jgi:hypothetical protein
MFGKLLAYPLFFNDGVNGVLAPNDVDRWVEGTALLLLQDPPQRSRMVANARAGLQARLAAAVAAKLVGKVLLDAIQGGDRSALKPSHV